MPFNVSVWKRGVYHIGNKLSLPLLGKLPDPYVLWINSAFESIGDFLYKNKYEVKLLISFAQPMSVHLLGLRIKKLCDCPWIAHFSDPWVDNPYNRYDPLTRYFNLRLEKSVMEFADMIIFVSEETAELVMNKYDSPCMKKVRILPWGYDPLLYSCSEEKGDSDSRDEGVVMRYLGLFYGRRSPEPLFRALTKVLKEAPALLKGVRIELVGKVKGWSNRISLRRHLPFLEGIVEVKNTVSYMDSINLMCEASGLILIDAPAKTNVFFPSKLADYIGTGKPIFAITPEGTSRKVVEEIGGICCDPSNIEEIAERLIEFITLLKEKKWSPNVERRQRYSINSVIKLFESYIKELV